MAQRTETELKTFLEGSKDQYDAFIKANGAEGVLFFDTNNHAVYAKDKCVIKSNVASVELVVPSGSTGTDKTAIKLTYFDGSSDEIDTAIPNAFVRFDATQNLTDPQKEKARVNIGAEAADATILKQGNVVNNLTTDSATVPLSAAQGKELKRQINEKVTAETGKGLSSNDYTDGDKEKLDGIDPGAQTNREVTVNGNTIGLDSEANQSAIKISGNLVTAPNNGEDSRIEFYLSHQYYPTENKIRFFKTATPPETYNETTDGPDVVLTIDTSDFVQAGMINNVKYNDVTGELSITFPTIQTDGTLKDTTVKVDLSKLVDIYKAGNGLTATVGDDGTTFTVGLGNGLAFDANKAITLSLAADGGLYIDNSGKLVVDFANNGVTSINGMGGGAYTINTEGVEVGTTGNTLRPIEVVNDSAAKKLKIKARPADMLAQFFHENNEDATSGIRAKGVKITEDANGNPYSMLMDFTPKVWSF